MRMVTQGVGPGGSLMLYISRYIGQFKYGVVDTDDGIETVVQHKDLVEYVLDDGVEIKGVVIDYQVVKGKPQAYVKCVDVYQDVSELSRAQTKAKVLQGIDIRTYGDKITSITVNKSQFTDRAIRLSDYGKSCGEYIFKMMAYFKPGSVTFILDDKIEIVGKSFKDFVAHGIRVDMREVNNRKTVEYICKEIANSNRVLGKMDLIVIDSPTRVDYYIGVSALNRPSNASPEITNIMEIVGNSEVVNKMITKKYRAEFVSISKANFHGIENGRWATFSKEFARWLSAPAQQFLLQCDDYDALRQTMFVDVFKVLRECSTCNKSVSLRFENYIKYFDVSEEVKVAFVRLCHGVGKWILRYAKEQSWIR